ncbi:MAG: hypothetical protein ACTS41_01430 [Candidatus Hodgkinia cicadicola]
MKVFALPFQERRKEATERKTKGRGKETKEGERVRQNYNRPMYPAQRSIGALLSEIKPR